MIKYFFLFAIAFLAFSNVGISQLNISDLTVQIANYQLVDSHQSSESIRTKTFVSKDSSDVFEINFNSKNEIVNDDMWDIAIKHSKLDQFGRVVEFMFFNSDGEVVFGDAPPIIQKVYLDSISVERTNYLNLDRSLESRMEIRFDEKGRELEVKWYDKNLKYQSKTTYEFDDLKHTRTEKDFDAKSKIVKGACNVAIKVIQFPESGYTENRIEILEERYYDSKMNLVDCHHNSDHKESFAIMKREKLPNNKFRIILLNSKNEELLNKVLEYDPE